MLQLSSGRKWKKCEQMLPFIAMHYWGYTSLEVKGQWGLLPLPVSSPQCSNQGLPVLHLGLSAHRRVSSGCAGPLSPAVPVLCYGPVRWSPPSELGGGSPTHAPLPLYWTMEEDRNCWWRSCTPRWYPRRSASTEIEDWLMRCDEETGREEQSLLTFDFQWHVSSVVHGYNINSSVHTSSTFALRDDNCSIQSKRQQIIFRTQVGNR